MEIDSVACHPKPRQRQSLKQSPRRTQEQSCAPSIPVTGRFYLYPNQNNDTCFKFCTNPTIEDNEYKIYYRMVGA